MSTPLSPERYWRLNRWLIAAGLLLGFVVTFGLGWFARELDFIFDNAEYTAHSYMSGDDTNMVVRFNIAIGLYLI